jgi:hypothetical protein
MTIRTEQKAIAQLTLRYSPSTPAFSLIALRFAFDKWNENRHRPSTAPFG